MCNNISEEVSHVWTHIFFLNLLHNSQVLRSIELISELYFWSRDKLSKAVLQYQGYALIQ